MEPYTSSEVLLIADSIRVIALSDPPDVQSIITLCCALQLPLNSGDTEELREQCLSAAVRFMIQQDRAESNSLEKVDHLDAEEKM